MGHPLRRKSQSASHVNPVHVQISESILFKKNLFPLPLSPLFKALKGAKFSLSILSGITLLISETAFRNFLYQFKSTGLRIIKKILCNNVCTVNSMFFHSSVFLIKLWITGSILTHEHKWEKFQRLNRTKAPQMCTYYNRWHRS